MSTRLGIDMGASSEKSVLMDWDLNILASASSDVTTRRPNPGWSEQNPASGYIAAYQDAWQQYRSFHPALKEAFVA